MQNPIHKPILFSPLKIKRKEKKKKTLNYEIFSKNLEFLLPLEIRKKNKKKEKIVQEITLEMFAELKI